jgi:anti-sigma regulatory factor (Ser/Thr protein kinase)
MVTGPIVDLALHLPADESAAGTARRALDRAPSLPVDVHDRFRLAVSEVVTNAVQHGVAEHGGGDDEVGLVVRVSPTVVRVEVVDPGPGFDYPPEERDDSRPEPSEPSRADPERESGWGLLLVEQTTDRWGVEPNDPTTVWFEIDLPSRGDRPVSPSR